MLIYGVAIEVLPKGAVVWMQHFASSANSWLDSTFNDIGSFLGPPLNWVEGFMLSKITPLEIPVWILSLFAGLIFAFCWGIVRGADKILGYNQSESEIRSLSRWMNRGMRTIGGLYALLTEVIVDATEGSNATAVENLAFDPESGLMVPEHDLNSGVAHRRLASYGYNWLDERHRWRN